MRGFILCSIFCLLLLTFFILSAFLGEAVLSKILDCLVATKRARNLYLLLLLFQRVRVAICLLVI